MLVFSPENVEQYVLPSHRCYVCAATTYSISHKRKTTDVFCANCKVLADLTVDDVLLDIELPRTWLLLTTKAK